MKRLFTLVLVLFLIMPAFAEKRAFTLDDLYALKSIYDPQISPDGKKIAFVVSESDYKQNKSNSDIYVMDADGSNLKQVTFSDKADYHPRWSPDGQYLMFLSSREDGAQIWLLPTQFGEARQLSSFSTGIVNPEWTPDAKHIIFSSDVFPECGADDECNKKITDSINNGPLKAHMADDLLYRHWNHYRDGVYTHIMKLNVDTEEITDLTPGEFNSPPFSLGGETGFDVSPDSKELCFVSKRVPDPAESTNTDLYLVSLAGGEAKLITDANDAFDGTPTYSPDGRYIAYRVQTVPTFEADRFRIALYDRKTGERRILTEKFDNHIDSFNWSSDSKYIYFIAQERGYYPLYKLNIMSETFTKVPDVNSAEGVRLSPDSKWLAFTDRRIDMPIELFRAEVDGKRVKQLTTMNQAVVDSVDIRPAEQTWVQGADGKQIHVFIVKPHGFDPSKKYPLIVNVHGGPQMQWSDSFRGQWQIFPGAGYVIAFMNAHGSTGYGQEFTNAISKAWNGKVIEDIIKVTSYLGGLDYIDADRMGAMGWSWGGYAMNWLQGHNDDGLFKCFVSMMGVYDLKSMYGATEELWFPEWDMGGTPWNSELYQTMSPSNYVQNFKTPMLVITGERDYRVPYTQSLQLFTALQKMGVPSRLIVLSNDGHWPHSVRSMPFYYNAHLDWFHQYLGGEKAPYDMNRMLRNQAYETEE
ncbi:S9 family peptidase [candidate division KSB1 bacterium]|nr:S9 family peptidase [candidate division KSB1 bacterium]